MADQAKRFEIIILRPLFVVFLVSGIAFLFKAWWWWLAGSILGLFYLGIVGSKLHPLQSASDLAEGPLEGASGRIESKLLPPAIKLALVGHACTRVGILIGVTTTGVVLWVFFEWSWYFSLLVAWPIMMFAGALLKLAFKTVSNEA